MSRTQLARELAEQLGRSMTDAHRFITQVGAPRAQSALRAARGTGSATLRSNWFRAGAVGGGIGGGALYWRGQDVDKAEALASESRSCSDAVQAIMDDDDLSARHKRDLVDQLLESCGQSGTGGGDGGGGIFDRIEDLFGFGKMETMILLMVVAVVAVTLLQNSPQAAAAQRLLPSNGGPQ